MTDSFDPNDHAPLPILQTTFGMPPTDEDAHRDLFNTWSSTPSTLSPAAVEKRLIQSLDPKQWTDPLVQGDRDALIDQELRYRQHPTNPKNAARAGWYAGVRHALRSKALLLTEEQKAAIAALLQQEAKGKDLLLSKNAANKLTSIVVNALFDLPPIPDSLTD